MAKFLRRFFCFLSVCLLTCLIFIYPAIAESDGTKTPVSVGPLQQNSPYYGTQTTTYSDGTTITREIINGPSKPPAGYEPVSVALPAPNPEMGTNTLTVPTYNWVFGCSSVSGAMILGYYDLNAFPNMYAGPANSGVAPLNNSTTYWPTWSDGTTTYPNLPLAASHNGVDGRATKGSIDDYWVLVNSVASDPYITGAWTQHTWGTAIGDYMKTSQSAYGNVDGSTSFWNYNSNSQLTCAAMPSVSDGHGHMLSWNDGTYGRKLFYEARGYTVTTCYNQNIDNNYSGGFTFAQFKAEIDAGRPVMLNMADAGLTTGHTVVGVGYNDPSTVYLHDTWHQDGTTQSMTWTGTFSAYNLLIKSVSIVNLVTPDNPVPAISSLSPDHTLVGGIAFTLTVNGSNFVSNSQVKWNDSNRTTTFVSATQLTATISATDINTAGTADVTVVNPAPGGGTSTAATFSINNLVPVISSLSPTWTPPGGTDFTLTVNGSNFANGAKVRWNGFDRTTIVVSAIKLTATILAADIAALGTADVTVFNPLPGGGTSTASTFTISNTAPAGPKSSGCFIATAAFGSPLERHVQILRDFRDRVLLNSALGKAFVKFYYEVSPSIADKIAASDGLRLITRVMLMPVIGVAYLAVHLGMLMTMLFFTITLLTVIFTIVMFRKKMRKSARAKATA